VSMVCVNADRVQVNSVEPIPVVQGSVVEAAGPAAPAPLPVLGGGEPIGGLVVGHAEDWAEADADRMADVALARLRRLEAGRAPVETAPDAHVLGPACDRLRRLAAPTGNAVVGNAGGALDVDTSLAIQDRRGSGQPLGADLRRRMESAFGASFSAVRVHADDAAANLNAAVSARAFTTGQDVFFGRGQFAPGTMAGERVLAHELAHTLQDDAHGHGPAANNNGAAFPGVVRRYVEFPVTDQREDMWPAGRPVRVSEDGRLAVAQEDGYGSHHLWAESDAVDKANHVLQTSGALYRVGVVEDTLAGTAPMEAEKRVLNKVVPTYAPENQSGDDMTMPDDCGVGAHEVTGAVADDPEYARTEMVAVYRDAINDVVAVTQMAEDQPMRMKREILLPHIYAKSEEDVKGFFSFLDKKRNLIDKAKLQELDRPLSEFRDAMRGIGGVQTRIDALLQESSDLKALDQSHPDYDKRVNANVENSKQLQADVSGYRETVDRTKSLILPALQEIDNLIVSAYGRLTPREQDEFERAAQINRYAVPTLGQAYAISTGGKRKQMKRPDGGVQITYNVHWAGVIMQSGGDTVTMENSAEHVEVPRNRNWIFQMYGRASDHPSKAGQTFHEQNRDVIGAHGEAPTTMTVKPKGA
jgi:hypothetical protein